MKKKEAGFCEYTGVEVEECGCAEGCPKRMFLGPPDPGSVYEGRLWCVDQQSPCDVEYLRADQSAPFKGGTLTLSREQLTPMDVEPEPGCYVVFYEAGWDVAMWSGIDKEWKVPGRPQGQYRRARPSQNLRPFAVGYLKLRMEGWDE